MHVLTVLDHPDPNSFSAAVAQAFMDGAASAGHECELADLNAEGFDPRWGMADRLAGSFWRRGHTCGSRWSSGRAATPNSGKPSRIRRNPTAPPSGITLIQPKHLVSSGGPLIGSLRPSHLADSGTPESPPRRPGCCHDARRSRFHRSPAR